MRRGLAGLRRRGRALAARRDVRALYCLAWIAVFAAIFLASPAADDRAARYAAFGVNAYGFPGGDARNIQMAAHCARLGEPILGDSACVTGGALVVSRHVGAWVPHLNYPTPWVWLYGAFDDGSERYFLGFWIVNALAAVLAAALLCYRYGWWLLPLAIFSPCVLLGVERGNVDLIVFALVFVPLLLTAAGWLHGFCLGLAVALKLFPAFGLAAVVQWRPTAWGRRVLLGALPTVPLIGLALFQLPELLRYSSFGYASAYGLASLYFSPLLDGGRTVEWVIAAYLAGLIATVFLALMSGRCRGDAARLIAALDRRERALVTISLLIFLGTFLFYASWAYRLVFLLPALVALAGKPSVTSRVIFWSILAIMWLPLVPTGWLNLNFACMGLAPVALFLVTAEAAERMKLLRPAVASGG